MCTPMAAVSAGATLVSAAAQSRQANANARATQAEVDRQTATSREEFDDRNTRLIQADNELRDLSRGEYERQRDARRTAESEVARILTDAVSTQRDIGRRTQTEKAAAGTSYNELLGGARERQAGYAREGDAAVDETLALFDFGTSETARLASADKRDRTIQSNIKVPQGVDAMGDVPAVLARRLQSDQAEAVGRARSVGTAGAKMASYADALRRSDENLQDGSEDLNMIGRKANRDLTTLGAGLKPYQTAFETADMMGRLDIENTLAAAERESAFRETLGTRIIGESTDYEADRAAAIDDYVTTLNSSSSAYEEALRRNAATRLSGMPKTSTVGNLFGAIGSGTAAYAANGQGPSWGKVGSYLSALGGRPTIPTTGARGLPASF